VASPAIGPSLGTLSWLPAHDHAELLAPVVSDAISRQQLRCFVAAIDPALADTAAFCESYQVPREVSANCVVVAGRRAESVTMAACLILATDRADVNKTVRRHLDVRKISFADMAEAVSLTAMAYGGITPIGLPPGWPILIDQQVAACPWIVIGSGIRGSKIAIRGGDVAELPSARVLKIAHPSAP
jgi:prolyl-tRNA editing enzyme YbaK/EbsC (Cys-tRNA(Pro) deacylase)